jgi:hypothetical protein
LFKEEEILRGLLLLAIFKKERDVSLEEVFAELVEVKAMSQAELNHYLEIIKKENLFSNNQLTFLGVTEAKKAEEMFSLQK